MANKLPGDFCAFILTHGRPNNLRTLKTLEKSGYTGKVYIVIDNEDKTADEYRNLYGDMVLQFDKSAVAKTFDEGDNFDDRRAIVYARNACFDLARRVGCRYFIQLDDDYTSFEYRFDHNFEYRYKPIRNINAAWSMMLKFKIDTGISSIAMSQGGDHIGGGDNTCNKESVKALRKAMNSFICDTQNPFQFFGRINEDVNTYTCAQRRGDVLFFSLMQIALVQLQTQSNAGGMTDIYLDSGTYVKSFYSLMYAPSCVRIRMMGTSHRRLHHSIAWDNAAPKIIRESFKR